MADPTTAIVATAYVMTAASYLIILSRMLLRRLRHETFKPDDYLMLFAMVLYAVFTAAFIVAAYHGMNISKGFPKEMKPDQVQYVILGSKSLLISRVVYISYLWTLKTCMLIYYFLRLPQRTQEFLAMKIAGGSLAVTWVTCIFILFLECIPLKLYWQVLPSASKCAKAIAAVILTESANISTNLLLMAIPVPIILRPVPPLKAKLRFAALYLFGLLAIIVSILRMVAVLKNLVKQNEWIWVQFECFLATIVANAPIIHGLYRPGCNYIRKEKFGRVHCTTEYELTIRAPTSLRNSLQRSEEQLAHEEEETVYEELEPPHRGEHKPSRMSDRLRSSFSKQIQRMTDRVRTKLQGIEVERRFWIVQETKIGQVEHVAEDPNGMDTFVGPAAAGLAHISTQVSCGHGEPVIGSKRYNLSRLSRPRLAGWHR